MLNELLKVNKMSEQIPENTQNDIEARGMPSVANRKKGGAFEKVVMVFIGILVVIALIAINGGFSKSSNEKIIDEAEKTKNNVVNILGAAPDLPEPPKPQQQPEEAEKVEALISTYQAPPPPPPQQRQGANGKKELTPEERKLTSGLLVFGEKSQRQSKQTPEQQAREIAARQPGGAGGFMGVGNEQPREELDGLGAKLKATKIDGVKAGLLVNRDMFITTGTFLDCALETAISSDLAGMTSCRLTRDVYSTSGKVLLLERGSRITGQYQGGLKRGQARIFVLWNRVETPNGVMVSLDSPGTGALGHTGHSGFIDTHFWERFGGAMMLSLVDDIGGYLFNQATNNENTLNLDSSQNAAQQAAAIALENSINIPPTLIKNQGDHINVFIARDLDFRGVYDLKSN
jgi:type IV secretion system protein VirB10